MNRMTKYPLNEAVSPVIGVMLMLAVTVVIAAVVSGFAGDIGLDKKTAGPSVALSDPVMDYVYSDGTTETISLTTSYDMYSYQIRNSGVKERTYTKSSTAKVTKVTDEGDPWGLVFTHEGGDPIDLKDLQMEFSSNDLGIIVDYNSVSSRAANSVSGSIDRSAYVGLTEETESGTQGEVGYKRTSSTISSIEAPEGYTVDEFYDLYDQVESGNGEGLIEARYFYKINPETDDDTIIRTGDQFEVAMDQTPSYMCIKGYMSDGALKSFYIESGTGNEWILSDKPSGQVLGRGDIVYEKGYDWASKSDKVF